MSLKIEVKLSVFWFGGYLADLLYYMVSTFMVGLRTVTHGAEAIKMVGHTF
jgi:hypothetical protein